MVTADIVENDLVKLLKEFDIFERNKVSLEIKLTAIAMYLLSKLEGLLYSLTGINCSLLDLEIQVLEFNNKEKIRKLAKRIAVDETV